MEEIETVGQPAQAVRSVKQLCKRRLQLCLGGYEECRIKPQGKCQVQNAENPVEMSRLGLKIHIPWRDKSAGFSAFCL